MSIAELSRMARGRGGPKARQKMPDNKPALVFLGPWLIGAICLMIGPIIASLVLSFTNYNLLQPAKFVGFDNFIRMLSDPRLRKSLEVTSLYVLISVPGQLLAALLLAILLNRGLRGVTIYRAAFYLPSLLGSSVAIAVLWRQVFGAQGLFNAMLGMIGIHTEISWIGDSSTALGTLILLHVWTFGSPMVIFLAGLRQIPTELYEAATTDGANAWQQFKSVTMPLLTPIIFFNLVLAVINSFASFTQAFIVSGGTGAPADSTLFYTLYLYQEGFGSFRMGYASALAWLLVIIVGAATAILFWTSKFWVHYED
ncbi:MAG: sugar ABC transporter permease [Propionibacteriaceae bacterium]|nr:sugar ABC transporter permease [Propionibacteriaceae bacterium]